MLPLDNLLSRLEKAKPQGRGYLARCPAHDDKSPSLSIDEKDDGSLLIHCFAGCPAADVLAAVGLELKDLFPASNLPFSKKKDYARAKKHREYKRLLDFERLVVCRVESPANPDEVLSPENQARYELALSRVKKLEGLLNE